VSVSSCTVDLAQLHIVLILCSGIDTFLSVICKVRKQSPGRYSSTPTSNWPGSIVACARCPQKSDHCAGKTNCIVTRSCRWRDLSHERQSLNSSRLCQSADLLPSSLCWPRRCWNPPHGVSLDLLGMLIKMITYLMSSKTKRIRSIRSSIFRKAWWVWLLLLFNPDSTQRWNPYSFFLGGNNCLAALYWSKMSNNRLWCWKKIYQSYLQVSLYWSHLAANWGGQTEMYQSQNSDYAIFYSANATQRWPLDLANPPPPPQICLVLATRP
jgi:hypothetical protein